MFDEELCRNTPFNSTAEGRDSGDGFLQVCANQGSTQSKKVYPDS